MRTIIVTFNSSSKIQKLKKVMKQAYSSGSNAISELAKFNLNKELVPERVERVEIEIKKIVGGSLTINVPKASLTFLTPEQPFNVVEASCDVSGKYIVLPWNIGSASGKEELKNIISKISTSVNSLKYTVYVNKANNQSSNDTVSQAELNLSESSFEDNTEELFVRIAELENRIRQLDHDLLESKAETGRQQNIAVQKDTRINELSNQLSGLNSQLTQKQNEITSLSSQLSSAISSANSNVSYYSGLYNDYRTKYDQEYNARQRLEKMMNQKKRGEIKKSSWAADFLTVSAYCWTGTAWIKHQNGGTSGVLDLYVDSTKDNW